MGRLFWKFFFAFWVVLSIAGVGVGLTVWFHKPPVIEPTQMIATNDMADTDVLMAAVFLEARGQTALRDLLAQTDHRFPLRVIDENGREILGRPIPPELITQVRHLADQPSPRASIRKVHTADGHDLVLFVPQAAILGPGPPPMPAKPPSPWVPIGFGFLASIAFSALLAWSVAKPIRLLRHAFNRAARGNLETRVQPLLGRRRDELGDLCRDFDDMAQQLQDLIRSQRRLFHDVSHELRSPLSRIQAAIGLTRQNPMKTAQGLDQVERDAARLDALVGELLTLARLESGMHRSAIERVDVLDLLDSLVEDARFEAQTKGCTIDYRPCDLPPIDGHTELIGRAVENVLRNAVRHTPPGKCVTVSVQEVVNAPDKISVMVRDQGPGIPESDLKAIFEPFFRIPQGPNGPTSGYGLGLTIARRAVEAHHGTIRAENVAEGGLRIFLEFASLPHSS